MVKFFLFGFIIISAFFSSQTTDIQYMTDKHTGCKVIYEKYWEADRITWNGKCKNNLAEGKGILSWYMDQKLTAKYTGTIKEGNPSGKGEYIIDGYGTMSGNFVNGWLEGQGKMTFSNGGKIQGNFSNGEFLNLDQKYLPHLQKIKSPIKDVTSFYGNDGNSDELFYYTLVPKGSIKAVLVLFPSTSETAENVISCNRQLMQNCYDNNVLSVVLSVNFNNSLEIDKNAMTFFDTTFEEIIRKFNAPKDKFILDGLSLGGNNALLYTQMSRNPKYKTIIKPIAVIGVDPPVDMADLYYRAKESIELYSKEKNLPESIQVALNESKFLIDDFHKSYGGSPEEFPEKYIESSNYSRSQPDGGNAKYLTNVPVRLYADPDIIWNLKYKNRDYYHINAAGLSAMINLLMMKGNKKAEFIPAIGKGYRVDGTRHPHSWSIVDPDDCIQWVLETVK